MSSMFDGFSHIENILLDETEAIENDMKKKSVTDNEVNCKEEKESKKSFCERLKNECLKVVPDLLKIIFKGIFAVAVAFLNRKSVRSRKAYV